MARFVKLAVAVRNTSVDSVIHSGRKKKSKRSLGIGQLREHRVVKLKQLGSDIKKPRGPDDLLGHLLVKRIPVIYKLSSTKLPENLSQCTKRSEI